MSYIFYCPNTLGYKNRILSHEAKFQEFLACANYPKESSAVSSDTAPSPTDVTFAVHVVKQTNYSPLGSKRCLVTGSDGVFVEVTEHWLVDAKFGKLNTFKNLKCVADNKFFEVNTYQEDSQNAHHWRANVVRSATEIDS